MNEWTREDAKNHFDELIDRVDSEGPQTIRLADGKEVVVEKSLTAKPPQKRPSIVSLFRNSPLLGLIIPRTDYGERPVPFAMEDWEEDSKS